MVGWLVASVVGTVVVDDPAVVARAWQRPRRRRSLSRRIRIVRARALQTARRSGEQSWSRRASQHVPSSHFLHIPRRPHPPPAHAAAQSRVARCSERDRRRPVEHVERRSHPRGAVLDGRPRSPARPGLQEPSKRSRSIILRDVIRRRRPRPQASPRPRVALRLKRVTRASAETTLGVSRNRVTDPAVGDIRHRSSVVCVRAACGTSRFRAV